MNNGDCKISADQHNKRHIHIKITKMNLAEINEVKSTGGILVAKSLKIPAKIDTTEIKAQSTAGNNARRKNYHRVGVT